MGHYRKALTQMGRLKECECRILKPCSHARCGLAGSGQKGVHQPQADSSGLEEQVATIWNGLKAALETDPPLNPDILDG